MLSAEVAVYPLKTNHATLVIDDAVKSLENSSVDYSVGSMNTLISGNEDAVFESLKNMFKKAQNSGGEISMVVTISNACD